MIGCHLTMDKPDSVSRVTPPRTTAPKMRPDVPRSQMPMVRCEASMAVAVTELNAAAGTVAGFFTALRAWFRGWC